MKFERNTAIMPKSWYGDMAIKVITQGRPGGVLVQAPPVLESRSLALELHLEGVVGADDFCYTPQLGNNLYLKSIDCWVYSSGVGKFVGGFFYFMQGTTIPDSQHEIANHWNVIVPLSCGLKPGFKWFGCECFHRRFTMNKHYRHDGLRFAAVVEQGFTQAWETTVAFEIMEV